MISPITFPVKLQSLSPRFVRKLCAAKNATWELPKEQAAKAAEEGSFSCKGHSAFRAVVRGQEGMKKSSERLLSHPHHRLTKS